MANKYKEASGDEEAAHGLDGCEIELVPGHAGHKGRICRLGSIQMHLTEGVHVFVVVALTGFECNFMPINNEQNAKAHATCENTVFEIVKCH